MKKLWIAAMVMVMLLTSVSALADRVYDEYMSLPEDSLEQAKAAAQARVPQAEIDHLQLDYDDRRLEWNVFYKMDGVLGVCEVDAKTYEVIRAKEYSVASADALTASQAIEALEKAKGSVSVTDLDLERDDGRLLYEGEAELDGRFYDFEMTVEGKIIEWERD